MKRNHKAICSSCAYFCPIEEMSPLIHLPDDAKALNPGQCRKLPPAVVVITKVSKSNTEFPLIPGAFWCGEHPQFKRDQSLRRAG